MNNLIAVSYLLLLLCITRETSCFVPTRLIPSQTTKRSQPHSTLPFHNNVETSTPHTSHQTLFSSRTNKDELKRRSFLTGILIASSFQSASPAFALSTPSTKPKRAKGAAEYDAEYYLRDIFKGNNKEGNLPASLPLQLSPPRTLREPLLSLLLDDSCGVSCIAGKELMKRVGGGTTSEQISGLVEGYRSRSRKAFGTRAQWDVEHVTDQYYFDLTSYALWRVAGDVIPDYTERDIFARDVGRGIYKEVKQMEPATQYGTSIGNGPLTKSAAPLTRILDLFNSTQFCSTYRLGQPGDIKIGGGVFDELDDADFENGASVNCLVSVFQPAVLGAALQITGEGSRFSPDFVGATLAAMWEENCNAKVFYESYFVDQEYRPNPKDFFPDEQLLQFTITKKN